MPGSPCFPRPDLAGGKASVHDAEVVYGTGLGSLGSAGKALLAHPVQGKYGLCPRGELGSVWLVRPPGVWQGINLKDFGWKNKTPDLSCQKDIQTDRPLLNGGVRVVRGKTKRIQKMSCLRA